MIRLKKLLIFVLLAFIVAGCTSDDDKKLGHLEKGQAYFEKGEYQSAVLEFKNAVQIDPQYVAAYIPLAETFMKLGDLQNAFNVYAKVAELAPDNIEADPGKADLYIFQGNFFASLGETAKAEKNLSHGH